MMRMRVWGNGLGIYGVVTLFMVLYSGIAGLCRSARQIQQGQEPRQNAGVVDSQMPQAERSVVSQNMGTANTRCWAAIISKIQYQHSKINWGQKQLAETESLFNQVARIGGA